MNEIGKLNINGSTYNLKDSIPQGYCSTAAGTQAKEAQCTGFVLADKSYITVDLTTTNTYDGKITLNINNTGAKDIYINGEVSSSTNKTLPAGSYLVYYEDNKYYFRTDGKISGQGVVSPDGSSLDMQVDEAINLVGETSKEDTFLYRPTANHIHIYPDGKIDTIKGNTVVWNQLMEYKADGTYTYDTITYVISSNKVTVNGSVESNTTLLFCNKNVSVIRGHKYLLKGSIGGENKIINTYRVWINSTIAFPLGHRLWSYDGGMIQEALGDEELRIENFYIQILSGYTATNLVFVPQLYDLTLMFGAGNEPATVEEFESWLSANVGLKDYYPYNEGELIPTKVTGIKTVGFNLLKLTGRTEYATTKGPTDKWNFLSEGIVIKGMSTNGYIYPHNIGSYSISKETVTIKTSTSDASSAYGTGFPIRVLPNTSYYVGSILTSGAVIGISWFDKEGHIISYSNNTANSEATSPANAYWGVIVFKPNAVNTEVTFTNPVVNLSHSGSRNGEYEPYWTETKQIPITTLTGKLDGEGESVVVFPDGMKRAGSAYDEIVNVGGVTKAIKRIGSVDLGTLTWDTYTNAYEKTVFWATLSNLKLGVSSVKANLVCTNYTTDTPDHVYTSGPNSYQHDICAHNTLHRFYLSDSQHNTAPTQQDNWLSGVIVHYELDNPQEYILDDFELPLGYKVDDYGTEEQLLPASVADELTSCAANLNIIYGINARDSIRRLPYNYVSAVEQQSFTESEKALARRNIGISFNEATPSTNGVGGTAGLMSATDKEKLNNISMSVNNKVLYLTVETNS